MQRAPPVVLGDGTLRERVVDLLALYRACSCSRRWVVFGREADRERSEERCFEGVDAAGS